MASAESTTALPLEVQRQIDSRCREFEQHWKDGLQPKLEEFLGATDGKWRRELVRELLAIELAYRQIESGEALADSQICLLHRDLMPELLDELQALRASRPHSSQVGEAPPRSPATPRDAESTEDHTSQRPRSRGLHIRCPHCSNPVELLSDTPHESITCRVCGSNFSLVDQQDRTIEAPVLKKLGRFELLARLGVGGFGTVWKARDTELDRAVAVKIPRKGQLDRAEIEQFLREARTAAQLRHANIVPVHEVGREGETIFIVSDLIRGVSLSDWLSGDLPSFEVMAELGVKIAEGLHHAHQKGVIHRDLKPSNVLIDELGQPHVMDFGLAKRETDEITMTVDGQILGTPAYMSPEQAGGQSSWTDRRTDIYSLGVILFRMLTGELPFRGNSQMQIHQRLTKDPPDPRSLNHFIPRDLSTICLKCLETDPNRRYSSAKELAEELKRYLSGEPILSRPISKIERTLRWAKRKPMMATTIGLTLFLAIAGPLAALLIERQRDRLQQLVVEKNNLIDQDADEKKRDVSTIADLRQQLDAWEGRANPWKFWPPEHDASPRRQVLDDFVARAQARRSVQLRAVKYDAEGQARGYLGLAMLADAIGHVDDATEYYRQARDQLAALRQQNPQQPRFALALAECDADLARLYAKTNPEEAVKELENERMIRQQLAVDHKNDPTYQIGWLEAELNLAVLTGVESRAQHLDRVSKINQSLSTAWPSDSPGLYRMACFLLQREPVLTPESKDPVY